MIIVALAWRLSATIQRYVQTYAPTNIAIAWLRTCRCLKWAILVALVVTPLYAWASTVLLEMIDRGGPPWLGFVAMLCVWNAPKFGINALLTPFVILRYRLMARRQGSAPDLGPPGVGPVATRDVEYADRRG